MLPLLLVLAATPNSAQLDAQEAVNDVLEARFGALCTAIKTSGGRVPSTFAKPPALLEPRHVRWVKTCSFRALSLSSGTKSKQAHVLWEIDGLAVDGERVTERGEAEATLRNDGAGWVFTGFTDTSREVVRRPRARFTEVDVGLTFPTARTGHLLLGGLAVRDFNSDDVLDVAATDGADVVVFTQRDGRFTPKVISRGHPRMWTSSVVAADFDADGDVDLVVTHHPGMVELFRNDGGEFTLNGVIGERGQWHSAVTGDLDGDGHLDLALLPYPLEGTPTNPLEAHNGFPLQLYRGDGALRFTRWLADVPFPKRWTLAAVVADVLNQGRPQLYVANDYGSNDLWRFENDGGATNVAASAGLVDPGNGMSADVADFDGDGRADVYVANMFSKAGTRVLAATRGLRPELMDRVKKFARGNTLYLARDGGFDEVAVATGVNRGLWAFGSVMTDVDSDGRLDVAVANGYLSHPNRRDS